MAERSMDGFGRYADPALVIMTSLGLALFVAIIVVAPAAREAWGTRRPDLIRPLAAMTAAVLLVALSFVALYINATTLTCAQMQGLALWPATAKIAVAACLAVWLVALTLCTGGAARLVRRIRAVDPEDLAILACFFALFTAAGVVGVITWGAALLIQAPRAFGTAPTAGWLAMVILALAVTSALAALARTGITSQSSTADRRCTTVLRRGDRIRSKSVRGFSRSPGAYGRLARAS